MSGLRSAVGGWVPSAASAPADGVAAPAPEEESRARLLARIAELEARSAALPSLDGPAGRVRLLERPAREVPDSVISAVIASVIAHDASPSRRSFLVDAGLDSGVRVGHPAVCGDSLVGVVVSVSRSAARVLRIDDRSASSSFPAAILRGSGVEGAPLRSLGASRGTGDGRVRVSLLPAGGAEPGDFAVVAAGARLVPQGLVLGAVRAFADDDRDGICEASVEPLRALDELSVVTILLTESPGLGDRPR